MRHLPRIIIVITLGLLHACSQPASRPDATLDALEKAKQLLTEGEYPAAAEVYLALATKDRRNAGYYRLRAADALLAAGEIERAGPLIDAVSAEKNDPRTAYLQGLLQAKIALYKDEPREALRLLAQKPAGEAPTKLAGQTYLIRAQSYERLGQHLAAVRERLHYQGYITSGADAGANAKSIWAALNQMERSALNELREDSTTELKSWLDLALINKTLFTNPTVLRKALSFWRAAHPEHPASPQITETLLARSRAYVLQPQQLALLLPFSGRYRQAAEAIRDGLLAAWYHSKTYRPVIKLYDADANTIRAVYDEAVAAGADFIIGPLEKQAVIALAESGSLAVVTLTLNQAGEVGQDSAGLLPNLIQFGLSPEDEARQVAERALSEGHSKALILRSDTAWGRRMAGAFRQAWRAGGGYVLDEAGFAVNSGDFAGPVKRLLNVDVSERRARKLQRTINRRLVSETRLRGDADLIFLAAPPLHARQLLPQFRYHKAESIPAYSTSHIFSGIANPALDADMDGVRFADMPWVLSEEANALREAAARNWQAERSVYRRLYALGADSFNIIPHLSKLAQAPGAGYAGQTGVLSLNADGLIQRRLLWGKIEAGRPALLDN